MKTDIQIARECELKPIGDIAAQLGIPPEDIEPYGRFYGQGACVPPLPTMMAP